MLGRLAPAFRQAYPDVTLEISLDDAIVDLVTQGYDAGIRMGDAVEKDMVAVRLTPQTVWFIAGAPRYLALAGKPQQPEELVSHEAIRWRFPSSRALHLWRFKRGKREFQVDVKGGLIVNDRSLLIDFAVQGLGLAFVSERETREHIAAGRLEALLQAFIPDSAGLYLYFPERTQAQLKLRVFVDMAKRLAAEHSASSS